MKQHYQKLLLIPLFMVLASTAMAADLVSDNEWITPNKGCVTSSTSNGKIVVENHCPSTVRAEGCFVQPPVDPNSVSDLKKVPAATLYRLAVFAYCKDQQTQSFGFGGRPTLAAGERRVLKFDEALEPYLEIVSCPERAMVKMVSTSAKNALCMDYSVKTKLEAQRKPIADSLKQPRRSRLDALLDDENGSGRSSASAEAPGGSGPGKTGSNRLNRMLNEDGSKLERLMLAEEKEEKDRQRVAEAAKRMLAQQAAAEAELRRVQEREEERRQRQEDREEEEERQERRRADSERRTNVLLGAANTLLERRYARSTKNVNTNAAAALRAMNSGSGTSGSGGSGSGKSDCSVESAQWNAEFSKVLTETQGTICKQARALARLDRDWLPRYQSCDASGYLASQANKRIAANDRLAREVCDDRPAQVRVPGAPGSQRYTPPTPSYQNDNSAPVGSGAR